MENLTAHQPVACTLDTEAWPRRLEWIADLNRAALIGARRQGRSLVLTYKPKYAAPVRELIRRERQCCAFLSFDLREAADDVTLVIGVPESAGDGIDAILAPFSATTASRSGCGCNPASGRKGDNHVCG
jgi:hypothetical protein